MDYKVGLTEDARNDLSAAVRFIAEEGQNPDAALRLGNERLDAALSLAMFPRRGSPVRRRPGMRKLAHRCWLIFYQVNEEKRWVEVVRIWDGRKDRRHCDSHSSSPIHAIDGLPAPCGRNRGVEIAPASKSSDR